MTHPNQSTLFMRPHVSLPTQPNLRSLAGVIPCLAAPEPEYDQGHDQETLKTFEQLAWKFYEFAQLYAERLPNARLIPQFHKPEVFDESEIVFLAAWGKATEYPDPDRCPKPSLRQRLGNLAVGETSVLHPSLDAHGFLGYIERPSNSDSTRARVAYAARGEDIWDTGEFENLSRSQLGGVSVAAIALNHGWNGGDSLRFHAGVRHDLINGYTWAEFAAGDQSQLLPQLRALPSEA